MQSQETHKKKISEKWTRKKSMNRETRVSFLRAKKKKKKSKKPDTFVYAINKKESIYTLLNRDIVTHKSLPTHWRTDIRRYYFKLTFNTSYEIWAKGASEEATKK